MNMSKIRTMPEYGVLLAILLIAAALRLNGVAFGLPALNDPDEPLFVMTALDMLRNQSLNPGWFGHPGTTTLYVLALLSAGVAALGLATGRFESSAAFVHAIYADPGIVFLPGRLFIVACGIACVYLTYRIARNIAGPQAGLAAAAFLTVNAVHIHYSQIIRTDMHVSVFMLLCLLCAIEIARSGRLRYYVLAGICVGLSCATKWPGAAIAISPICASLFHMASQRQSRAQQSRYLLVFLAVSVISLVAASPFLVLDYGTVLQNLQSEARPKHLGATGHGLIGNLTWYVSSPLSASIGWPGLLLAALGIVWGGFRHRLLWVVVLPSFLIFLLIISAQALVWERWLVPVLPLIAIFMAAGLTMLVDWLRQSTARSLHWLAPVLVIAMAAPMVQTALVRTAERKHDTRQMASAWVRANVPEGSTILIEDAAFDLMRTPVKLLFPVGTAGCVDVHRLLSGGVRYSKVETLRSGRPIVDLGNVDLDKLATCGADYAIFTHLDRYASDPVHFPQELAQYRRLMKNGAIRASFRPVDGQSSGPVTYVIQFAR